MVQKSGLKFHITRKMPKIRAKMSLKARFSDHPYAPPLQIQSSDDLFFVVSHVIIISTDCNSRWRMVNRFIQMICKLL